MFSNAGKKPSLVIFTLNLVVGFLTLVSVTDPSPPVVPDLPPQVTFAPESGAPSSSATLMLSVTPAPPEELPEGVSFLQPHTNIMAAKMPNRYFALFLILTFFWL